MAERISAVDPAVDELRRKARRRLVGAIVLALAAAVILPMLLEKEPRPLGEDVQVKIPPVDQDKFVNRLSPAAPKGQAAAPAVPAPSSPAPSASTSSSVSSASTSALAPNAGTSASAPSASPAPPAPTTQPLESPRTSSDATSTPASIATSDKSAAISTAGAPAPSTTPAQSASASERPDTKSSAATPPVAKGEPASPPKVESKPDAKGPPAAEAGTKGKASEGGYVVQLAAFSDDKGANALAAKLKRNGYSAYTEAVKTSRGTLYRVRVGGYASREAAGEARNKLKGDGYAGIVAAAH